VVEFSLGQSGALLNARVLTSSGLDTFDARVLSAIKFPDAVIGKRYRVTFRIAGG